MSQKVSVPHSLQLIKSLPGDFRMMGAPASSDPFGESGHGVLGNSEIFSSRNPGNGFLGAEAVERVENSSINMDQVNEDSPYGVNTVSVEDRPSVDNEDLDSMALPSPSVSASRSEHRWGDTTSYAAKKVFYGFCFRLKVHTFFFSLCVLGNGII